MLAAAAAAAALGGQGTLSPADVAARLSVALDATAGAGALEVESLSGVVQEEAGEERGEGVEGAGVGGGRVVAAADDAPVAPQPAAVEPPHARDPAFIVQQVDATVESAPDAARAPPTAMDSARATVDAACGADADAVDHEATGDEGRKALQAFPCVPVALEPPAADPVAASPPLPPCGHCPARPRTPVHSSFVCSCTFCVNTRVRAQVAAAVDAAGAVADAKAPHVATAPALPPTLDPVLTPASSDAVSVTPMSGASCGTGPFGRAPPDSDGRRSSESAGGAALPSPAAPQPRAQWLAGLADLEASAEAEVEPADAAVDAAAPTLDIAPSEPGPALPPDTASLPDALRLELATLADHLGVGDGLLGGLDGPRAPVTAPPAAPPASASAPTAAGPPGRTCRPWPSCRSSRCAA